MKCPTCNAELPATAKFCGACGTTLAPAAPEPPRPAPPAPEPPRPHAPPPEQPRPPQPPAFQPSPYAAPPSAANRPGGLPPVEKRFRALRFLATLVKILAFVVAGLCVIAGLIFIIAGIAGGSTSTSNAPFNQAGPTAFVGGFVGGVMLIVYGAFAFVFLYAYAEMIYLFLGIEENTRITNEVLRMR